MRGIRYYVVRPLKSLKAHRALQAHSGFFTLPNLNHIIYYRISGLGLAGLGVQSFGVLGVQDLGGLYGYRVWGV